MTIWDDDVPRTFKKIWDEELEEYVWMEDEDVPLGNWDIPETGDPHHPALWLTLWTAAAAGLMGTVWWKRKEDEESET